MRRLLSDLGSILLALGLAIIVWVAAVNEDNPVIEDTWPDSIPIEVINQPAGTIVIGDIPGQVEVTIRATRRTWDDLQIESFRASVDLSGTGIGMQQIDVQVECSDRNVEILEHSPGSVSVRLEKLKEVEFPVQVDVLDAVPFGFEIKLDEIASAPNRVLVSGPEQLVDQVTEVVADFYLRGANATVERKTNLQARDTKGGSVAVAIQPNSTLITVPIVQRSGFRNLSVRVVWEGQPAQGHRISNVSVDPTIVTAIGNPTIIEGIPGYLETSPVKVDGATADVVERVPLVLPDGVSILGSQAVQVTVSVAPIMSSLTVQRQVVVQGLAVDYQALPSPATVDVIVSGPLPKLDALRPQDIQVIVDLFNMGPGSYQLVPIVILPEGITNQSVVPEKVQVEISQKPTVTPTSTQTASPTRTWTPTVTPTLTATATPTPTVTPTPDLTLTLDTPVAAAIAPPAVTPTEPAVTLTPAATRK